MKNNNKKARRFLNHLKDRIDLKFSSMMMWFVFSICIFMDACVIFSFIMQYLPFYDILNTKVDLGYTLEIHGSLEHSDNNVYYVCVGGYKTKIDYRDDDYSLRFKSKIKNQIPVCILDSHGKIVEVDFVSYSNNEFYKCLDFIIEGKNDD